MQLFLLSHGYISTATTTTTTTTAPTITTNTRPINATFRAVSRIYFHFHRNHNYNRNNNYNKHTGVTSLHLCSLPCTDYYPDCVFYLYYFVFALAFWQGPWHFDLYERASAPVSAPSRKPIICCTTDCAHTYDNEKGLEKAHQVKHVHSAPMVCIWCLVRAGLACECGLLMVLAPNCLVQVMIGRRMQALGCVFMRIACSWAWGTSCLPFLSPADYIQSLWLQMSVLSRCGEARNDLIACFGALLRT